MGGGPHEYSENKKKKIKKIKGVGVGEIEGKTEGGGKNLIAGVKKR